MSSLPSTPAREPAALKQYRHNLLAAIIKWTRVFLIAALILNSLWFLLDFWITLAQQAGVLLVILIGWWCSKLLQRGQLHGAARIYLGSGVLLSVIAIPLLGPYFALMGIIGVCLFIFLASLLEYRRYIFYWGALSVSLYLIAFTVLLLFPLYDHTLTSTSIFGLYIFPPAGPIAFMFLGRSLSENLDAALTTSENMRHELEQHRDHLQDLVADRTAELNAVNERQRQEILERKQVEVELNLYRAQLEDMVKLRTTELTEAYERLQELDRLKDTFITNVSHELRTPVTILQTNLFLLNDTAARPEYVMPRLTAAVERLIRIIDGIILVTDIQNQVETLAPVPLDFNQLVAQYASYYQQKSAELGLKFTFHSPDQALTVPGEHSLLERMAKILLDNALNYTPSGGQIKVELKQFASAGQQWIGLTVHNTGPGIPENERSQLFKRFFRGQSAVDAGIPGSGTGLYVAREIALAHQGRIEFNQQDGPDAADITFTVLLPLHSK